MKYYYLTATTDLNGNKMEFVAPPYKTHEERARTFYDKIRFTLDAEKPWNRPPSDPSILQVKDGTFYEGEIFPSLIETPIPAMSIEMIKVINDCGVVDMDFFPLEIRLGDGNVISHDYRVFKLYTFLNKSDLNSNPNVLRREATDILIFKKGEDYTRLYVHEKLKKALEDAKIPFLMFHDVADITTAEELS